MILECHNTGCGNQLKGECGMHTTNGFRCKDRRDLVGRPLDLPPKNKAVVAMPDGSVREFKKVAGECKMKEELKIE